MTKFRIALVVLLITIFVIRTGAEGASEIYGRAGTAGGMILDMGMGARGVSVGEAFTAEYGNADMIYWNVGAIGLSNRMKMSFTHIEWLLSNRLEHLSIVYPLFGFGAVGLNAEILGYGTEKKTLENSDGSFAKEEGTFSGMDMVIGLNYGYEINVFDRWSLGSISAGVGLNYIRSDYDKVVANAVGVNVGLLYRSPVKGLLFGMTLKNLGTKLKYIEQEDPLPTYFKAGGSYGVFNKMIVFYADVKVPTYQYPSIHAGVEVTPIEYVSLRAGYKYTIGANPLGWLAGLSAGLGINLKESVLKFGELSLDYAFVPYGDLGITHRISLELGIL